MEQTTKRDYKVLILGTGFGGSMTAIPLAEQLKGTGQKILMLERGTWWTTPVGTVQDKEVWTRAFLERHNQPVQVWSTPNHFRGFIDLFTRCFRRTKDANIFTRLFPRLRNEDGLFDFTLLGTRGFLGLGLVRAKSDGISVIRASGVGGGSLVYSNITIRPPDFIFDDPRWPLSWNKQERHEYFEMARDAIGTGIVFALRQRDAKGTTPVKAKVKSLTGEATAFDAAAKTITVRLPDKTEKTFTLKDGVAVPPDFRLARPIWLSTEPAGADLVVTGIQLQGPWRINTGLSNINTRSARLEPHWLVKPYPDPAFNARGLKQIDPKRPADDPVPPDPKVAQDPKAALWIDRARVFQNAMKELTSDFGSVDLAINDLPPEPGAFDTKGSPKNYCERQGRCNIGCLPGARHTLNKQLMRAVVGRFNPDFPDDPQKDLAPDYKDTLLLETLAEVDVIEALPDGGYAVHYEHQTTENYYRQRDGKEPRRTTRKRVTADIVIVAAGCLGTNEILLRSKTRGTLPNLSERTGFGFSTNGDYPAFLENTKERVSFIRGPVTTSFGHFNTAEPGTGPGGPKSTIPPDKALFHTIEDQGLPPATASVVGEGEPLIRALSEGSEGAAFITRALYRYFKKRVRQLLRELFTNSRDRGDFFRSEEEIAANMMCVVAMGREASVGQFSLGRKGETPLRIKRADDKPFWDDPIYKAISDTLDRLAAKMRRDATGTFKNPFVSRVADTFHAKSIALSHPLGGCRMARSAADGVCDEYGHVFDASKDGPQPYYEGLYITDAAMIPTALGVNPSLTITTLALRMADKIAAKITGQP